MSKLHFFFIFLILFISCEKDKINPSGLPKKVTVTNVDNEVSSIIYFFYDNKNRLSKEIIQLPDNSIVGTYTFGYIDDQIQVKYNSGLGNFTFTYIVDVQTKKILKRINTFYDKSYEYVYEYKQESQKTLTIYSFYYVTDNNLITSLFKDFEFKYWEDALFTLDELKELRIHSGQIRNNGVVWNNSKPGDPSFIYLFDKIPSGCRPLGIFFTE